MTIKIIIVFLIGILVGGELAYHFFYSPKAMIKKLWKEIFKLTQFKVDDKKDSVMAYIVNKSPDEAIEKRKKMINALFGYLDHEKDKEFIEQHKP